jgi:hypothetical protein
VGVHGPMKRLRQHHRRNRVLEDHLFLLIRFENHWVFVAPDSFTPLVKSFLTISAYLFDHGISLFLFTKSTAYVAVIAFGPRVD